VVVPVIAGGKLYSFGEYVNVHAHLSLGLVPSASAPPSIRWRRATLSGTPSKKLYEYGNRNSKIDVIDGEGGPLARPRREAYGFRGTGI